MFEKKRGKRFLASVMALVMLLSLAPVGALATEGEGQPAENQTVTQPANGVDQKPVETGTANTNEETTPPPAQEGIAVLPANNNNAPVALPETPVIVKPTEVLDPASGMDSDTSKDNGIAEYGSNDYIARTVKVAVYATDGSDEHSKVNTDIAKLLGIPCKQEDGYYPIGVIEIPKSLVTGRTPYINTEEDWEAVKAAIEKIDTSWLTNNTGENIDNVAGSKNKENTISKNLDKVQVDLKHEAGSHKTALFTWNGASQNIRGDYNYHLDLRFATVTLKFVGVIEENSTTIELGKRIYLTNTEIREPGTSDDFYLTGIPNGYQINGYYSDENLSTVYTFDDQKATADDTIYVELVQKPVTITYDLNGGNLNGETESVVYEDLKVGDNMRTPNDPEREGHTFKGWKDKDGNSPSQQVTGDATYFAQWETIPDPEPVQSTDVYVYFRVVNTNDENVSIDGLSVKYNANAGGNTWCTFGKISTTKELTLDNVKTDAITQLRSENAQIHTDNAGIKDKVLSNVTWYQLGTWAGAPGYYDSGTYWHLDGKITGYKVTYATGADEGVVNGMPDASETYYLNGSEYTVSDATPTRDGCTFAGWKSSNSNDNTVYTAGSTMTMPGEDVTLTAVWKQEETPGTPTEPTKAVDAKYFVLLPGRGTPASGKNQGTSSYLPNETSDGGVSGENDDTGYPGGLTAEGKNAADQNYNDSDDQNGVFNSAGVPNNYLVVPDDLGFFTASNWKNGQYTKSTNTTNPSTVLGETFNVNNVQIIWYAIKSQGDGYHVDGYVAGIPVTLTYHDNFTGSSDSYTQNGLKSGETAPIAQNGTVSGSKTFSHEGYEFKGWYDNAACTGTNYAGQSHTMMDNLELYAKWEQTAPPTTGTYALKIKYVYENGTQAAESYTAQLNQNAAYKVDSPPISGYVASMATVEGTMPAGSKDVTVTYYLDNWKDADNTTGEQDKDSETGGDGIPDCDQVLIKYVSSNSDRGTVSPDMEVLTIRGSDKQPTNKGTVTASGSTATVTGSSRNYFSNWTDTTGKQVSTNATLNHQTILDVIKEFTGGKTYTFTANFGYSSGGGSGGSNRPKPPVVEIPDDVPTGLNGKDHYAYIIGYGNNDVRPQNNITRAEVATIFFRLLTDETRTANMTKSNGYNDVKDGDWFCCAVSTLSKMGIIKGYEDGSFKPNDPISRAEFAAIAARFDPDGDKTPATFADVTSHWAKDEISIAANHGWIKGYEDGSFKPDQKITRAETMTLVNRVLNRLPETKDDLHKDMKTWVDNMDETAWYYLAVQEATNSHYFKNKTGTKFEQWTDLRDTRDWSELEK